MYKLKRFMKSTFFKKKRYIEIVNIRKISIKENNNIFPVWNT